MGLINNDGIILLQRTISLRLRQKNSIRHKLHPRLLRAHLGKAHLPADFLSNLDFQLLRNPSCHRGRREPPRLGASNPPFQPQFPRKLNRHLWQLRRLP